MEGTTMGISDISMWTEEFSKAILFQKEHGYYEVRKTEVMTNVTTFSSCVC